MAYPHSHTYSWWICLVDFLTPGVRAMPGCGPFHDKITIWEIMGTTCLVVTVAVLPCLSYSRAAVRLIRKGLGSTSVSATSGLRVHSIIGLSNILSGYYYRFYYTSLNDVSNTQPHLDYSQFRKSTHSQRTQSKSVCQSLEEFLLRAV